MKMYSRFIIMSKNKFYGIWQFCQKKINIYRLDDIADDSNNTHHTTIKLKPINFKSGACAEYSDDFNTKKAKF